MGVLPIILIILAMKIPIFGLIWFAFWAGRMPETDGPAKEEVRGHRPRRPEPPQRRRPRRRGPHGGGAVRPLPCPDGAHAVARSARPATAVRHADTRG